MPSKETLIIIAEGEEAVRQLCAYFFNVFFLYLLKNIFFCLSFLLNIKQFYHVLHEYKFTKHFVTKKDAIELGYGFIKHFLVNFFN